MKIGPSIRKIVAAGLLSATLISGSASAASAANECIKEKELVADKMRFIQTQMMVAALQCRRGQTAMPMLYNNYVRANKTYLLESERQLSRYLKRGNRGTVTSYLTTVANRVSLESIDMPDFCSKMKVASEMAISLKNPLPIISVMPIQYKSPNKTCTAPIVMDQHASYSGIKKGR